MMIKTIALTIGLLFSSFIMAQDAGVLSGNFQSNFSVFLKDSSIGATDAASPQYGKQISSAEAWLFLNYDIKGFHIGARYDLFNNSNLLNPSSSFTGQGLGYWQIQKSIGDLELTVGSFYDQFGSGAIFRSYENRLIGIDYAVEGARARYQISDNFMVKAFTGKQKGFQENRFGTSPQIIKGINTEKGFTINETTTLNVGASAVNRTIDDATMTTLVNQINGLPIEERYDPKFNVYAVNGYFDINFGDFGVMAEYNQKSAETIRTEDNSYRLRDGNLFISSLSYSKRKLGKDRKGGIGANIQYRRVENFPLVVSPFVNLLNGIITYQPSFTRQASYRMLARYQAPAQFTGENAIQAEIIYSPSKTIGFQANYSDITTLDGQQLFSERFFQLSTKINRSLKGKIGVQNVVYNQDVYEGKPGVDNVETFTPFLEVTYKLNRKNSIRLESQYLMTEQDLGSFFHGIIEWNSSPHFTIAVSDMINTDPVRIVNPSLPDEVLHYPSFFVKYNIKTTSFTAAYIKQVEGVNCTGGICRLEPAFSGLRFTLATQF